MSEKLPLRRYIGAGLVIGLGTLVLPGCVNDTPNNEAVVTNNLNNDEQADQQKMSQFEIYPLEVGNDTRSANVMIFTLDDGTKVTCIESTITHPATVGKINDTSSYESQGPEFDTNLVCPESLILKAPQR